MLHLSTSTPHGPASQRALVWSGVGSSASDGPCTLSYQLSTSTALLFQPVQEGYGPYPVMTAPWSGEMCFCGREGVCVWEGLLLIMCTLGRAWSGGRSTRLDRKRLRC